jgi:hypothetical protein
MIPVETVPGIGGGGGWEGKKNGGGHEFKYDIFAIFVNAALYSNPA